MSGVVFASWHGYAGCVAACRHAAAVLGGRAVVLGEGGEGSPSFSAAVDAELLVLSSWTPAYERLLAVRARPTVARWHSPLLQTELSREGWKLTRLLELLDARRITALAVDDATVAEVLARPWIVHLPNVFAERLLAGVRPAKLDGTNVSLSGEPHGRKNLLVQSSAFELARRDAGGRWTLHLFGQTARRRGYARWLRLAGIPYVDHGFLPGGQQLSLVAAMDAGLCATLSESFGYAAAEHVALGVPAVVSRAVAAVEPGPLTADDPGDPVALAALIRRAVDDRGLACDQLEGLRRRASANEPAARSALRALRPASAPMPG